MAKRGRPPKQIPVEVNELIYLTRKQITRLKEREIKIGEICRSAVMQKLKGRTFTKAEAM